MASVSLAGSLADSLARQIKEGAFRAGQKLPSLRELAELHGYAKNTVVAAFEQLVERGLIEPRRGSGYYVTADAGLPAAPQDDAPNSLSRAMDIVWLMREQLRSEPGVLSVGDGYPPVSWLSDMRMDRFHQKVVRTGLGGLFRYGGRFGYTPLRQQLVRRLADLGIAAEPRQIVMTHGANQAMDLLIRYFVVPGAAVLTDDPGYYPLYGKLKLAAARILGVPRLPDGPDLDVLERLIIEHRPRLFFTQSVGHNPTGSDVTPAKAYRMLQLAQKHNLLIVENDPLADYKPTSAARMSALDHFERTIYIGTFSKSFSAALRVGFIACSAGLASDLADLKALIHVSTSELCERTIDVMLREGHYERYAASLRARLGETTASALAFLDGLGAEVFARPAQSLYLWAKMPGISDTTQLAESLLSQQVVMAPGRIFRLDSKAPSEWARYNAANVLEPRFSSALQTVGLLSRSSRFSEQSH